MAAPLLPRTISHKTVQIREDSKSPTHRPTMGEREVEITPTQQQQQQQQQVQHGGVDSESAADERLIEASATGMSYTVSASDLFLPHYHNHFEYDEALELAPMELLGEDSDELSPNNSYGRSPLMAISPFEGTASPFPHFRNEY